MENGDGFIAQENLLRVSLSMFASLSIIEISGSNNIAAYSSWISLRTNAEKTKVMTCLPGKIQVAQTEEEYASQQTGLGTATTKRRRVACEVCGTSLAAESL